MGCRSFCCRLIVRLRVGESVPGAEPGTKSCVDKSPEDGLCVHYDREQHGCRIWADRPQICRGYDCNHDPHLQVVLRDGYHSLLALVHARTAETSHRVPRLGEQVEHPSAAGVQARIDGATPREQLTDSERRLADELAQLRERLARAIGSPRACRECAAGRPLPGGRWRGGLCCAREPEQLFSAAQSSPLRAAGAGPDDYRAHPDMGGGCPYRGAEGCTLEPRLRPNPCVHYVCDTLDAELRGRDDYDSIRTLLVELESTAQAFETTHAVASLARSLDQLF